MKLVGKLRQRERARRRKQQQPSPSHDRRQRMLAERGARLSMLVGRERQCIEDLSRAVEIDPDDFRSRLTMAFVMLRQGRYAEAWPHYSRAMTDEPRDAPLWEGEPLEGRSIAIRFDSKLGLGDWLFGARYVRPLTERAARVVLEVPRKFESLRFNWPDTFEGEPVPATDFEISAMFIPPVMGPAGYRVALAWTGGGDETVRRFRSVPTELIERMLSPDVNWVSVERGKDRLPGTVDVADACEDDLGELAAVLSACDRCITVDNSTAHVAGALGRPLSLLFTDGASGGEWRWYCIGMEHSPWYPSARLFRRPAHGPWADVLDRVRAELTAPAASHVAA